MARTRTLRWATIGIAIVMLMGACGDDADDTTTEAPTASETTAAAETTAAPETTEGSSETTEATETTAAPSGPTALSAALISDTVAEEPWNAVMLDAWGRVQAAKPNGLDITFELFEEINLADVERVARELAVSGNYDMIWFHGSGAEAIEAIRDEFPDIIMPFSGSGNTPTGGPAYWYDVWLHEPAYLTGIAAGMMTETNKVGAVAAFPFPNVNLPLNAFIAGAQSVNPDVEAVATYIESWFDPAKAKDSAAAQIAAGADAIYAERFGPFDAAVENEGVIAVGHFSDQTALAPDIAIASTLALWDPSIEHAIGVWLDHMVNGTPYDAPLERHIFSMAEGGAGLVLNEAIIPDDVVAAIQEAQDKIMNGELAVEANEAPIE